MATPNVGADPINPAYYAGTACAEIIEHMPTNVGFAAKYAWRLGEKDSESQEAKKAIWYLERELQRDRAYTNRAYIPVPFNWNQESYQKVSIAALQGKLDNVRSEIVSSLIAYTMDQADRHLDRAINLFHIYTG